MKLISVIIPAKNEERYISLCLKSIISAKIIDGWRREIIVIDNMSSDNTASIARDHGVKVFSCKSKKIGEIRAFGASVSSGEVLAYVDADCAVKSCWITTALNQLEDELVGAVGGYLDLPDSPSYIEKGWALPFNKVDRLNVELVGASFIIKRDVYSRVGGFNKCLSTGEDSELSRKVIGSGFLTKMIPGCNVVHYGYPSSIRGFIDRQVWQVSGQFSSIHFFLDKSIVASLLFVISIVSAFLMFLLGNPYWLFFALVSFLMPLIFGIKRIVDSGGIPNVNCWSFIYFVSVLYFVGRFLGVVLSVISLDYKRTYK